MESKLSFLFTSTTLHGFKYLAVREKPWKTSLARIFWTIFVTISTLFMVRMLDNMLQKQTTSTTINLDTIYLDWHNAFPAISVCLTKGRSTTEIKNLLGTHFTKPNGDKIKLLMRHYRAIQGYLFLNYIEPLEGITVDHCLDLNETCGIDFNVIRNALTPQSCKLIMEKMFFLGKEVDCEDYFEKFETEIGICFVANSLYSKGINGEYNMDRFNNLKLRYSNQDNVERSVEIHYKDNQFYLYKLLVHTPEELPDGRLVKTGLRKIGSISHILLKTIEFHNSHDVKHEPIESRMCRFPSEHLSTMYLPYSLNYCKYLKRVKMEMKECNCTLPVGFRSNHTIKTCNVNQFECPDNLARKLKDDMKDSEKVMKSIGDCLVPTCVSMEIIKIGEFEKKFEGSDEIGAVKVEIVNKPTLRYIRRVSFSRLDVIGKTKLFSN